MNEDKKIPVDKKTVEIIQRTFKGNEKLLQAIRAVMFGLAVTDGEVMEVRSTFASDEVNKMFWDRFLPTLSKDSPIGQVSDIYLGTEQMVFGQTPQTIEQALMYKERSIDMTRQALRALRENVPVSSLEYSPTQVNDPLGITLLARNQFIRHVEQQLLMIWLIASQENPTVEDVKVARKKNSSA